MDWIFKIKNSLIKDISLLEAELQFYINVEFEVESEKISKIKKILDDIVLKEQSLIKWDKITDNKNEE